MILSPKMIFVLLFILFIAGCGLNNESLGPTEEQKEDWKAEWEEWREENGHIPNLQPADSILARMNPNNQPPQQPPEQPPGPPKGDHQSSCSGGYLVVPLVVALVVTFWRPWWLPFPEPASLAQSTQS